MAGMTRPLVLLICCLALLSACNSTRKSPAPVGEMGISGPDSTNTHMVVRGDTLYSIAWRYGLDFKEVAAWNGISAPYQIFAGKDLAIVQPQGYRKPPAKKAPRAAAASRDRKPKLASKPVAKSNKAKKKPARAVNKSIPRRTSKKAPAGRGPVKWSWPTSGKLLRTFSSRVTGRKGIDIAGQRGQKINAAASGKVVYSGSGLVGYGKLIIVKHNDKYLSAYGHNDVLLVKQGHFVKAGQTIAKMGLFAQRAQLHFEIRKDGKPVDPMKFLPRR